MSARPIAFVDVETDGLGPQCRAWEIAIIRREDGEQTELHWFLPLDLRHADPVGLDVGGFWDRHPSGRKVSGKPPAPIEPTTTCHEAARDIMRLTFGATLVGAGVHFDAGVLSRLLRAEGYLPSWHYRLRCVTTLASGRVGRDVGGLDDALDALALAGVQPTERHTAIGDARAAMRIYDTVLGGA